MRRHSDERLTELARGGSDAAFEAIVSRYRRSLLRRCARVLGETDAEEAVQETLIKTHLALRRGEEVRRLGPWLHAVAHNAALNMLRSRTARPDAPHSGCDASEVCSHLSGDRADESAERRQDLRDLVARVQQLPQRQREAIVMRELEGLTYKEIATRLGASHGAVRQLLGRARAAIRQRLGAFAPFEPLLRTLTAGGSSDVAARVGTVSGGCALTIKLCAAALVPAVVAGVAAPVASPPARRATHPIVSRGRTTSGGPVATASSSSVYGAARIQRAAAGLVITAALPGARPPAAPRIKQATLPGITTSQPTAPGPLQPTVPRPPQPAPPRAATRPAASSSSVYAAQRSAPAAAPHHAAPNSVGGMDASGDTVGPTAGGGASGSGPVTAAH